MREEGCVVTTFRCLVDVDRERSSVGVGGWPLRLACFSPWHRVFRLAHPKGQSTTNGASSFAMPAKTRLIGDL